ncbi:unnamed protein product [Diamesa tonsa]
MHALKSSKTLISPVVKSRGARFLDMVRQSNIKTSPNITNLHVPAGQVLLKGTGEAKSPCRKHKHYLPHQESKCDNKLNPKSSSPISSKRRIEDNTVNNSPTTSYSAKKKKKNIPVSPSSMKNLESINSNRCLKNENNRDVRENEEVILTFAENTKVIELESSDEENPQNTAITTSEELTLVQESQELFNTNHLLFKNKQELLDYISKNITVDELLESLNKSEDEPSKYLELVDKVVVGIDFTDLLDKYTPMQTDSINLTMEQNSNVTCIINKISKMMQINNNIKHKVLDILSEKHSSEFLEHALQENSTNSICDKMSMKSVVKYIIHKVNVGFNDDTELMVKKLNVSLIHQLVSNTVHKLNNDQEKLSNDKEIQELLALLFTNKPKIDVFDALHEFLRQIVKNN